MRLDTALPREATPPDAVLATTRKPARPLTKPGLLRVASEGSIDLFLLLGLVFSIPVIVLAIGLPVAVCVRLLLWLGGQL